MLGLAAAALILTQALSGGIATFAQGSDVGCELTPLELPLFGGTPVATFATPSSVAALVFADEVDVAQVQAALEQYVACTNTGDPAIAWAVFTPRWYAQNFVDPEEHYLPAFESMLDGEMNPPANPLELVGIHQITSLEDTRVEVVATFGSAGQTWTDALTLAQVDGVWLIDDVRLVEPAGS